ncbi:MAG: peptide maturation system acyl carrier-related protein [Clostridia bacterium]|nr:peptide maturation system acyl carrier-related protein [Clostridia bacterium]
MNRCEDVNRTKEKLNKILENRFGFNLRNLKEGYENEELLGRYMQLKARDLLYLYFEVEKEFNIKIPEEAIAEGKFNTLNNIAQIIHKQKQLECAS